MPEICKASTCAGSGIADDPKDKKTHLFVAVDKFTKWIEVESVSNCEAAMSVEQTLLNVAWTVHRLKGKVTISKTRPSKRDSCLRNQRVDQEDQDKPKGQDINRVSEPGQVQDTP